MKARTKIATGSGVKTARIKTRGRVRTTRRRSIGIPAASSSGEVVLYRPPGGRIQLEVRLEHDTVWLTQAQRQAMTHAAARSIDTLTPAWRELETRTPVKLRVIENEKHYRAMVDFMNELVDEIGDRKTHPLMGLLDIVTSFVRDYEERNVEIPDAQPSGVLRFLIQQHELRQADLSEIFGSQSNVSEVLSGKREINARQARLLANRFGASPAVFI